jgi:hypothetical protein
MGEAEPVWYRGLLSAPELEAEGMPAEEQTNLGWSLNTRLCMIILPFDKYEAWTADIRTITIAQ